MIKIKVEVSQDGWDSENEIFVDAESIDICLEHSLVSISKWESIWNIPFFSEEEKTSDQILSYIKCMTVNEVEDYVYDRLSSDNVEEIRKYIDAPMTATYFYGEQETKHRSFDILTSEKIYYWMIALNIPVEFQHWHIKRLMTLIKVCNIENNPKKNKSAREVAKQYADLNAKRRKEMGLDV